MDITASAAPSKGGSADDIALPGVRLFAGDCRERLRDLPDASVDSCVTDAPYDLVSIVKRFGKADSAPCQHGTDGAFARAARGFMGQTWDGTGVAFDPATWREVLRVLKPGGYLLAFGGSRTYHRMACAIEDAGFELRDQIMWIYGSGFPKSHNLHGEQEGWGTALKPAHEPIAMARKPLIGSVAANVALHGTGAINIDGCRIGDSGARNNGRQAGTNGIYGHIGGTERTDYGKGRWPANIIHDGSDEVVAAFPVAPGQQGDLAGHSRNRTSRGIYGDMKAERDAVARGDSGTAARFFYCAKATRADREAGCEALPTRAAGQVSETSGQHITRRDEGYEMPQRANHHPTVKPTDLMRYLVRMVTPTGGTVLDPFTGSGSTGRAAILEGFEFVGCELTPEYLPIAEARIADARRLRADEIAAAAEAASPGPLFAGVAA
jgi:site-specific DNA-methyltransferase (adenine-specific)